MKTQLSIALLLLVTSLGWAQNPNRERPFSWDNSSVYFVIQDRFNNGNTANDHSYGRGLDGNGNEYGFDEVGNFYGGDFAGLTQKINEGYFDELGVNAIWFSAPYEQIHGWVAGKNGSFRHYAYHGYYGLDWTEMDANFGTEDEFRTFVDAAHDHGIRLVMDIVMNHTGYNSLQDMEELNFGCVDSSWKGWRPNGSQNWESIHDLFIDYSASCDNWGNWWGGSWVRAGLPGYPAPGGDEKTQSLAGLPDIITESGNEVGLPSVLLNKWSPEKLNQEQAELNDFFNSTGRPRTVRNHFVKWLTDWVREYGIDGFRVDTEKHVEGPAWKTLKEESVIALQEWKSNNPSKKLDDLDFWMVAENFGAGFGRSQHHIDNGYDAVINFAFQGQGGNLGELENIFSSYSNVINAASDWNALSYISSHDTKLFDRGNLMNAGTSLLLLPGAIQIFYGDETGRAFGPTGGDPEQGTRSYMNWGSIDNQLLSHWQKLGQFRRNHLSIGGGSHQKLADNPYTFKRELGNDRVVVAVGANGNTSINVAAVFPEGTALKDFYTGQEAIVSNGTVTFTAGGNGVILIEESNPVVRPVLSVSPANGFDPNTITMTATASDANDPSPVIYYTSNMTLPISNLSSWDLYQSPVTFTETVTVKVVAQNNEGELSTVVTRNYTIGAIDGFTVYYQNTSGFGQPTIYYWLEEPDVLTDLTWPGVEMTDEGNGWFSFDMPGILNTNIIFSDVGGSQTEDLSRASDGWYVNGVWLDEDPRVIINQAPVLSVSPTGGTFSVGETIEVVLTASDDNDANPEIRYTLDGSEPSNTSSLYTTALSISSDSILKAVAYDTEGLASNVVSESYSFEMASGGMTIYYKGGLENPTIYFWGTSPGSQATGWPGEPMTVDQNGWYSFTFNQANCTNVIFSSNGASQTADLSRCEDGWYTDGLWYDAEPVSSNDLTIYYKPVNYTDPEIYFWNATPSALTTTWPGETMASIGNGWYSYVLDGTSCTNLIFSNNGASQTADLSRCDNGWYENGQWFTSQPGARIDRSVGNPEVVTPLISVYPNPSSGKGVFRIQGIENQTLSIQLLDMQGQEVITVFEGVVNRGSSNIEYEVSTPGMYLYEVQSSTIYKTGKLVIK